VTAFGSYLYAFLGIIIIYYQGKKLYEAEVAFASSIVICLATPLIYYMTMEPLMTHTVSMFGVTLFVFYWFSAQQKGYLSKYINLGLIGGLVSIVRYQDAFFRYY